MTAAVAIDDVHYSYPDGTTALVGVSLTVQPGERIAVLGPNGAGKTTLMLQLNGLLRPTSGRVRIAGAEVDDDTVNAIRGRVGLVFQDPDDQLFMPTVRADVAFGPSNQGLSDGVVASRVEQALAVVSMTEAADRPPHHLSLGQRRRVAVATVLSMNPDVLVLDEPSSNLDPTSRREIAELVLELNRTTVMVTHDLPYALQLCPRSVILSAGRIVADGPTRDLLADSELLARHRLELPYGFDPLRTTA